MAVFAFEPTNQAGEHSAEFLVVLIDRETFRVSEVAALHGDKELGPDFTR
jgi:hypothetical protein